MRKDVRKPPPSERLVSIGRIGGPHGVKGEVRLTSFTQDPKAIGAYGALTDADGARQLKIVALRSLKENVFIARLEGVLTREAAQALNNTELYVRRDALPSPEEEEFYHADLIGLAAKDATGKSIGQITHVLNFGGGDILEITPMGGGEALLVPFTKSCIPMIDIAKKRLVIILPVEVEADPLPEGEGGSEADG